MNLAQAHKATGVAKQRLRDLIKSGELPAELGGRDWSIKQSDLERVLGIPDTMSRLDALERTIRTQQEAIAALRRETKDIPYLKRRVRDSEDKIKRLERTLTGLQEKKQDNVNEEEPVVTHNSIAQRLAEHGVSYNSAKNPKWDFPLRSRAEITYDREGTVCGQMV